MSNYLFGNQSAGASYKNGSNNRHWNVRKAWEKQENDNQNNNSVYKLLILNVAPLDTFTAVLTKTPVQGVAPSKPQTRFETASPFTSID